MNPQFDFVVIGAGIAGITVATHLSEQAKVLVLDMESQPAYHTTGRSAALYLPSYGPAPIRALSRTSESFLRNPSFGADSVEVDDPILTERQAVTIAREDQLSELGKLKVTLEEFGSTRTLTAIEASELVPVLKPGYAAAGLIEPNVNDIDVNVLLQMHIRQLTKRGGKIVCSARVERLERRENVWHIDTGDKHYTAPTVINAAGAWADSVGHMAGAITIGLVPKRRTVVTVDPKQISGLPPAAKSVEDWPIVADVGENFYLKPDAGHLLLSPADETPVEPCDAQPEEMDIAICVDRVEQATTLNIDRILNQWAGLRSFVEDKCPVCGFDPLVEGFFWLAGQGGYGIQTSPALSRLAASLVLGDEPPGDVVISDLNIADVLPDRLPRKL